MGNFEFNGKKIVRCQKEFNIVTMRKSELAMMYFPDSAPDVARRNLWRWMDSCVGLKEELKQMGYVKTRHIFLKKEVETVVKYLGEP